MAITIRNMADNASNDKIDGKVFIMYERIRLLQSLPSDGDGDGDSNRWIEHRRLIIQLGFNCSTIEYFHDSVFTLQGLVVVGPFDLEATGSGTLYHAGDLMGMSTKVFYKWIQDEFRNKELYNVLTNNCQHFVCYFFSKFEELGYLTRTGHLKVCWLRAQVVTEGGRKIRKYTTDWLTLLPVESHRGSDWSGEQRIQGHFSIHLQVLDVRALAAFLYDVRNKTVHLMNSSRSEKN